MAQHTLYAHSHEHLPPDKWQTLDAHLDAVAERAAAFAKGFGSEAWARLLGELHDLGKARRSFQSYLRRSNGLDDPDYDVSEHSHSGAGACWAVQRFGRVGRILAYCVAGHHAGLPDWAGGETPNGALSPRLVEERGVLDEASVKDCVSAQEAHWKLPKPPFAPDEKGFAFWIRMLYSCLVDSDFLDTEAFMDATRREARGTYPALADLADGFFAKLDAKQRESAQTPVNAVRAEIRDACETMAEDAPGLFSLTVPTGGGKTLSAMAFAFRHAVKHGKRRIIYVIPYTSIIEQTADTLRTFLGEANVLEHHSNFDPAKETQQSRLAAENWDAPVIVTTTVQFFESLYACKSSRCRKLHNMAESVVILDEVQLLPVKLLKPCIAAIRELAAHYGTTFVLSTATQPNLPGLDGIREITPSSLDLYARLKRTNYDFPVDLTARRTWQDVAAELSTHKQVLCVVNTRKDCRELWNLMPKGTIHLSASMCGEHRSRVIAHIREMLAKGDPVRVISTQLVEAGVDIDFPIVYRAFAGLASIAQAAGRCNREGRLATPGRVVVFMPPTACPCKELRDGEYAMMDVLHLEGCPSFDSAEVFPLYFQKLQSRALSMGEAFADWLYRNARDLQFQFREAAAAFRMIGDESTPIVVRYGDNGKLIEQLRIVGPKRTIMRKLQRFTVSVPRGIVPKLIERGFVEEMHPGIFVQTLESVYSEDFGLDVFREGLTGVETIV